MMSIVTLVQEVTWVSLYQIKLADRQAALEKTQWEAMTSKNKVEKLQQELNNVEGEVSSFMTLFSDLTENGGTEYAADDYDVTSYVTDDSHSMVS